MRTRGVVAAVCIGVMAAQASAGQAGQIGDAYNREGVAGLRQVVSRIGSRDLERQVQADLKGVAPAEAALVLLELASLALPPSRLIAPSLAENFVLRGAEAAEQLPPAERETWGGAALALLDGLAGHLDEVRFVGREDVRAVVVRGVPAHRRMAELRGREASLWAWKHGGGERRAGNPSPTGPWENLARESARRLMAELSDDLVDYARESSAPDLTTEAYLRAGYWRLERGDYEQAMELLGLTASLADERGDGWSGYLAWLLYGKGLGEVDRRGEATAAFETAARLWPAGDAARIELAASLYSAGRPEDAALVAKSVVEHTEPGVDPWVWFPFGDFRHWAERIEKVRGQFR